MLTLPSAQCLIVAFCVLPHYPYHSQRENPIVGFSMPGFRRESCG